MTTEIPRIVILDLHRNAIATVEKLARMEGNKELREWASNAKKELGKMMLDMANDELSADFESEEDKELRQDEDFYL